MKIHDVEIKNFTAFKDFRVECGEGLNVVIGGNGTGKTLFLKVCRFLLSGKRDFETNKWEAKPGMIAGFHLDEFFPAGNIQTRRQLFFEFNDREPARFSMNSGEFFYLSEEPNSKQEWKTANGVKCVYLPAKDITENSPGFRSLYESRYISYDRMYYDLISALCMPGLRDEQISPAYRECMGMIQRIIGGEPVIKGNDQFYLSLPFGELDFTLVAEGYRKLAQLWLLIRNGFIDHNSILLWDEPDANLNPMIQKMLVEVLLRLARNGTQVFMSTHSSFMINEVEIQHNTAFPMLPVVFHAFFRKEDNVIAAESASNLVDIDNDSITEAYSNQFDRKYSMAEDD